MTRYKYFRSGIIYAQNWQVRELLRCILAIQKQLTNRPQVLQVRQTIGEHLGHFTWKTLKYLTIDDYFHLKDLEISKYKRESKVRMPIQFYCLIFVNCGLFTVVKELRSKMLGQHPGYFKAVFLKKTQIIIVSIYEYTVYIMFWVMMLYDCYYY